MSEINVNRVSRVYNTECRLENVTFQVKKGDFLAVIGPEGAGKTMLFELLMGLKRCQEGTIDSDLQMIYVPDDIICYEKMTVWKYFRRMMKIYGKKDWSLCDEYCDLFHIDMQSQLLSLTYDENKCVALIGALLTEPECIVLDEPYNFLTEKNQKKLMELLSIINTSGMTVIFSCERFEEALGFAQSYIYLYEGALLKAGKLPLDRKPQHMVCVRGGDIKEFHSLKGIDIIFENKNEIKFVYKDENMRELSKGLEKSSCITYTVESMTMEEEIFKDYRRWEDEPVYG